MRRGELAPADAHSGYGEAGNTPKPCGSTVEANGAVVRRRTAFLPGEISAARATAPGAAMHWVMAEKSAEVILASCEPGAGDSPF
jgi:hypothetical protein